MSNLDFSHLNTPCLLLDQTRLENNVNTMRHKAQRTEVMLRPHAKTAKCAKVMQLFSNASTMSPLTVSTLREAEYFAAQGFSNILYGVCITPDKLARAIKLIEQGVNLTVILDSEAALDAILAFSTDVHCKFSVAIEIDCDGHRAGLQPEDPLIANIATKIDAHEATEFWGIMTHGGASYDCQSKDELRCHAEQERKAVVNVAENLKAIGVLCRNISLGSTPTVVAAEHFDGVTEIRPGVFVFFDLFQAQQGNCDFADIALTVLATVTSHKPETNRLFIDAGGLALSKDRSTQGQHKDLGYGLLLRESGEPFQRDIVVTGVNQEHGVVDLPTGYQLSDFPIGSRVRVLPNHSCMTAAAYPGYNVITTDNALAWWDRCNGW